ncbi:lectin beta-1 and beta-2 chains-like [Vicia villosa]|uniref:lectin beta-1 and beta-2 chains-like n=1 Tax=Vicia villosa TaxID=3911 RepID=UPI00273C2370|nr:lectin beta-1 and beta-2 chains-like [Vicia villosa]
MATQTSFYVIVLSISLATFFFFKVNSTETTSFSITKFVRDQQNLIFQGDAYTTNEKLILTEAVKTVAGRVLYSAPIHIWDSKTGNVADFTTSFTFVIDAPRIYNIADGFTFFIAPVDTKPQTGGGYLGVFNSQDYDVTSQTVAVEFDTFYNTAWDPSDGDRHIGINVNSIKSISTKPWVLQNREEANVKINFDAATNVLSVYLTYPNSVSYTLSEIVPLKNAVPEWVRVGFSATTGAEYAAHEILSWSFHSELSGTSNSNQAAAA